MRSVCAVAAALVCIAGASRAAPAPETGEPAPELDESHQPYAFTISGGVSLGSYEAGVNWVLLRGLSRARTGTGAERPYVAGVTGASAGSINALLTAVRWCAASERFPELGIDDASLRDNLFARTWLPIGIDTLVPGPDGYRDADDGFDGILSRDAFAEIMATVTTLLQAPAYRPGCGVSLGLTVTRVHPARVSVAGMSVENQRFVIPLRLEVTGDGRLRFRNHVVSTGSREDLLGNLLYLANPEHPVAHPRDEELPVELVLRAVLASASFPVAFGPMRLDYWADAEVCPAAGGAALGRCRDWFIDGGVFDNVPLGVAVAQIESRLRQRRGTRPVRPVRYLYIDPGKRRRKDGAAGPRARHVTPSFRGLSTFLGGAVSTARNYELHNVLRYNHWNRPVPDMADAAARILSGQPPCPTAGPPGPPRAGDWLALAERAQKLEAWVQQYEALPRLELRCQIVATARHLAEALRVARANVAAPAQVQPPLERALLVFLARAAPMLEARQAAQRSPDELRARLLALAGELEAVHGELLPAYERALGQLRQIEASGGQVFHDMIEQYDVAEQMRGAPATEAPPRAASPQLAAAIAELGALRDRKRAVDALAVTAAQLRSLQAASTTDLESTRRLLDSADAAIALLGTRGGTELRDALLGLGLAPAIAQAIAAAFSPVVGAERVGSIRDQIRSLGAAADELLRPGSKADLEAARRLSSLAAPLHAGLDRERELRPTTRFFPLAASHVANFSAFLDRPLREYDYLIGVYDGLRHLAERRCDGPDPACLDRQLRAQLAQLGIAGTERDFLLSLHQIEAAYWAGSALPTDRAGSRSQRAILGALIDPEACPAAGQDAATAGLELGDCDLAAFLAGLERRGYVPRSEHMKRAMASPELWWAELSQHLMERVIAIERAHGSDELGGLVYFVERSLAPLVSSVESSVFATPSSAPRHLHWKHRLFDLLPGHVAAGLDDSRAWELGWSAGPALGFGSGRLMLAADARVLFGRNRDAGAELGGALVWQNAILDAGSYALLSSLSLGMGHGLGRANDPLRVELAATTLFGKLRIAAGTQTQDGDDQDWYVTIGLNDLPGLAASAVRRVGWTLESL